MSEKETIGVVLADDHEVVRSGLRFLLEAQPDIEVLAEAEDVEGAVRYALGHKPDVLVLDLNMGPESSLPAIPSIIERTPEVNVVVLTMQDDPAYAREAMRLGAVGYVLKHAAAEELITAVRQAATGQRYMSPALGAKLASEPDPATRLEGMSEREVEVLKLIALGHTNAQIAEQLYLSVRTVETHRVHIQQKTQRNSRPELVRYALDHGLID